MKVLVTGGTGFTGGHLCERLVALGYQVRALAREGTSVDSLRRLDIEIVRGDLCNPASLQQAVRGVEVVYHIAAIFRQVGVSPEVYWKVNAEGVQHLLEASVQNGVGRFVHCSTVGVHGHINQPPGNEETPYGPGDIYQKTKLEGEKIAQRYMKEGKIGVTIFRPAGIYGPRDLRFLKLFRAIKKRHFVMLGNGAVDYHLTYIDDLVDGIIRCGTQARAIGNIFILGGRDYLSLNQLARLIAEELKVPRPRLHLPLWPFYVAGTLCETLCKPFGIEPPLHRRRIDFFKKNRAFDISKAMKGLDYQPKIDVREGIHRAAQWYTDNGYL